MRNRRRAAAGDEKEREKHRPATNEKQRPATNRGDETPAVQPVTGDGGLREIPATKRLEGFRRPRGWKDSGDQEREGVREIDL